ENATLVAKDLTQQRVRRELELAHDLQLKLLPSPLVIASRVDVAARCRQAESVGGDFYNLLSLRDERIGVMIGDVTRHGFGAAWPKRTRGASAATASARSACSGTSRDSPSGPRAICSRPSTPTSRASPAVPPPPTTALS